MNRDATVVSLIFENDSAISASPRRGFTLRERKIPLRWKNRCDCKAKYLHALNHEVQITARFFLPLEIPVKIRSKYILKIFVMQFNVNFHLFRVKFPATRIYVCIKDSWILRLCHNKLKILS